MKVFWWAVCCLRRDSVEGEQLEVVVSGDGTALGGGSSGGGVGWRGTTVRRRRRNKRR